MSAMLIVGKLPRLAGLDMVIALTPYGKFPIMMDTFLSAGYSMLTPMGKIKPIFPMPRAAAQPRAMLRIYTRSSART